MRFLQLALTLFTSFVLSRAQTSTTLPPVTVKTVISSDGTPIYVEGRGNPLGPQLILAHGFGCTHTAFNPLWKDPSLLSTLYLVRYDSRGAGLSGKPTDPAFYASVRYAEDLTAIITAYNLTKPYFAGWSLGGAIAADIATNFPQPLPFSGLIWLAGLPYIGSEILAQVGTQTVINFIPGMETLNATYALATRVAFVNTLSANPVPYEQIEAWAGAATYLSPEIATQVVTRSQNATGLYQAGGAGWPLLLLGGSKDAQINDTATIEVMKPVFKNFESHIIPGAGHMVFYDATTTVSTYILNFIKRVETTKPYPLN